MDQAPLAEEKKPSASFRQMADRIDHNQDGSFGGAVVIVPPGDGEPINLLMLDPSQDIVSFWMTLQTKVQATIATLDESARRQNTQFGRR